MSEPISHTTTHTFNVEHFANPFLVCNTCKQTVTGYIVSSDPTGYWSGANYPCRHIGITSTCPSWSPVDGCRCLEYLGVVQHSSSMTKKNIFKANE
jgi:hypothetical protein